MEAASKAASRTAQLLTKDTAQEEVSQMMDVMASIKEQLSKVCPSYGLHRISSFFYLTMMMSSSFIESSVSILTVEEDSNTSNRAETFHNPTSP